MVHRIQEQTEGNMDEEKRKQLEQAQMQQAFVSQNYLDKYTPEYLEENKDAE